ncbi:MAG: PolC-type DNA polymerase III [Candidatus Hydrogenedentota bacterium]
MSSIKIKTSKPLTILLDKTQIDETEKEIIERASIESIVLKERDKRLDIEISSPYGELSDKTLSIIKHYFINHFEEIEDITVIQKKGELKEFFDEFWREACKTICNKNKVIQSVIDYLKPELKENVIEINIPDRALENELHRLGLIDCLREKIKQRINKVPEFRININEDLLKEIKEQTKITNNNLIVANNILQKSSANKNVIFGEDSFDEPTFLSNIKSRKRDITVKAKIDSDIEITEKKDVKIFSFVIYDKTSAMFVKLFLKYGEEIDLQKSKEYLWRGAVREDKYINNELVLYPKNIRIIDEEIKQDLEKVRIELHLHSKLSALDSTVDINELALYAKKKNIKAVALTDHGVVHLFHPFYKIMKQHSIKPILGMEGYFIDDKKLIYKSIDDKKNVKDDTMVIFDLETTSLCPLTGEVIEIGACKLKNGKIISEFNLLMKQDKPLDDNTIKITGITNEEIKEKGIKKEEAVKRFKEFCNDSVLVAHNAEFDIGFLRKIFNQDIENPVIDNLLLSRALLPELKSFQLSSIAKHLNIPYDEKNKHRALPDAKTLTKIFIRIIETAPAKTFNELNALIPQINHHKQPPYHITILVSSRKGLYNLYKLVSLSHINFFYRTPKILKSILEENREGLLLGTACTQGELFQALFDNKSERELCEILSFYDFVEVVPVSTLLELIKEKKFDSVEQIQDVLKRIISLADKMNKPVVAVGNVHYLDEKDEESREVLYYQNEHRDSLNAKSLYIRSAEEMEKEFFFLDKEQQKNIIYINSEKILKNIEDFSPIPDGFYPPHLNNAEDELYLLVKEGLKKYYGENPDNKINERLNFEWERIRKNRFAVLYLAAKRLVDKSLVAGFPVGSRGSVGSSIIAFLTGISEVNPLPPHYRCPCCKSVTWGQGFCEMDLKKKICERCGVEMSREGFNIPFEAFTGFDGKKVPDIDLNFSGLYQDEIFKSVLEMFGKDKVYRAGTIVGLGKKNAENFVNEYAKDIKLVYNEASKRRVSNKCEGSKRTIGQHPGGMIIIPPDKDIYYFTPIQIPANEDDKIPTTHFDYHEMESQLVKLDILGHDTPTILKLLKDYTGIEPADVPLDDSDTLSIFSSNGIFKISDSRYQEKVGTLGIPEFGTSFVRDMLECIKPKTFSDLVRVSGLSHGENVWLNNANDLIKRGARFDQIICVREDIMNQLIDKGVNQHTAFEVMESVRKGKAIKDEYIKEMKSNKVPDWYIQSCKKIRYLFPKAHAVAYTLVSFRIAYFKVHHPLAFYSAYFSTQTDNFPMAIARSGADGVYKLMTEIEKKKKENIATEKEKKLYVNLAILFEMFLIGIKLLDIDLMKSDTLFFKIEEPYIRPSLMAVEGLGYTVAERIVKERKNGEFRSIEDFKKRTLLNKTILENFKHAGILKTIPETDQTTLF